MLSLPNLQPSEKVDHREDGSLDVFDVWLTIQGEGPLVGTPAIFVRLAGCSLACNQCDSDYTSKRQRMTVHEIWLAMSELDSSFDGSISLAVITGGEPFRQNIAHLCRRLIEAGYQVQIETNGIHAPPEGLPLSDDGGPTVQIVCSPKAPRIHPDLERWVDAYKYVLDADHVDPVDGLPTDVLGTGLRPARPSWERARDDFEVFVQPADEQDQIKNQRNVKAAVQSCLRYGYRYSHQIHKLIGVE